MLKTPLAHFPLLPKTALALLKTAGFLVAKVDFQEALLPVVSLAVLPLVFPVVLLLEDFLVAGFLDRTLLTVDFLEVLLPKADFLEGFQVDRTLLTHPFLASTARKTSLDFPMGFPFPRQMARTSLTHSRAAFPATLARTTRISLAPLSQETSLAPLSQRTPLAPSQGTPLGRCLLLVAGFLAVLMGFRIATELLSKTPLEAAAAAAEVPRRTPRALQETQEAAPQRSLLTRRTKSWLPPPCFFFFFFEFPIILF